MTPEELADIEARLATAELDGHDGDYNWNAAYRQDVPALVAEVRGLTLSRDEDAAIRSALGQGASALVLVEALANAKAAQAELQDAIADVEANGQKGADHITDTGKKGAER